MRWAEVKSTEQQRPPRAAAVVERFRQHRLDIPVPDVTAITSDIAPYTVSWVLLHAGYLFRAAIPLAIVDQLALVAGMALGPWLTGVPQVSAQGLGGHWHVVLAVGVLGVFALVRLYPAVKLPRNVEVRRTTLGLSFLFGILWAAGPLYGAGFQVASPFLAVWAICLVLTPLFRWTLRACLKNSPLWQAPAFVAVGRGSRREMAALLEHLIHHEPAATSHRHGVRRLLDVAVAIPLGVLLLPLLALIGLAIKGVSPGPLLYSQERIGQDGRPFRIWKFRTMKVGADQLLQEYLASDPKLMREWEREHKLQSDPRIIPYIGRFLRSSSLDELPQLWNVLMGDMALVGPRPLPAYHLAEFGEPFCRYRQTVRPGVTGLWQVASRADGRPEMYVKWDTYYIEHQSLALDLMILWRTIGAVVSGNGAV